MSSRSASNPPESALRSKRLRFENCAVDPTIDDSAPKSTSPSAVAKSWLDSVVETLPKEIQPIATKFGHKTIHAYVAYTTKRDKLRTMTNDEHFIPKPLRFGVKPEVLPALQGSPEYRTLVDEMAAAVTQAGLSLKSFILRATEMNVKELQKKYHQSYASALPAMVEIFLTYYDEEKYNKHKVVKEYIGGQKLSFASTSTPPCKTLEPSTKNSITSCLCPRPLPPQPQLQPQQHPTPRPPPPPCRSAGCWSP